MSRRWSQNAGLIGVDGQALFGVHDLRSARQRVLDGNWTNAVTNQSYTPTHETITFTEDGSGPAIAQGPIAQATYSYIGAVDSGATSTSVSSFTFTSTAVGTAASDRHVIVAVHLYTAGSETCSSVTIAGNSMTQIDTEARGTTGGVSMWRYNLTTGTTATIVVNLSGTSSSTDCLIGVWNVNASSGVPSATHSGSNNFSISAPDYGSPIIAAGVNVNGSAGTSSISNCLDETEQYDFDFRSSEYASAVDGTCSAIGGASCTISCGSAFNVVAATWT